MNINECLALSGGTKALITGNDAYQKIPALLREFYRLQRVFIVADENTLQAAGGELEQILKAEGIRIAGRHIFPARPRLHAEYHHIETLIAQLQALSPAIVPVAIGSGTINDLVKRAAGELALPYLCAPTAASVDGFTASGASILKDGFKQTLPCPAPLCIAADTKVLSQAPAWLSSSGFGDLAGKIIAGADWLVAAAACDFGAPGAQPIEDVAWSMVQDTLAGYLRRSADAVLGDMDALGALFEALAVTGFALQYAGSSRPVSGAEHLFAHVWEMDGLADKNGDPVTHGHKVAMGTLAATAFLEILFEKCDGPPPAPAGFCRPSLQERATQAKKAFPAMEAVVSTCADKYPDAKTAAAICEGFRDTWKDLREKVLRQIMPYAQLKEMLAKAQCPLTPAEINLTRANVIDCARRAQMIRVRYNALDMAWDLGCFETVLAKLENSENYL